MADELESCEKIIAIIQEQLWAVDGMQLVDRNARKILDGSLTEFPAAFIMEDDDDVKELLNRGMQQREWQLVIAMFVKGATEDAAIPDLAALRVKVADARKAASLIIQQEHKGRILERSRLRLEYPELGNHVIAQGLVWEVRYMESYA